MIRVVLLILRIYYHLLPCYCKIYLQRWYNNNSVSIIYSNTDPLFCEITESSDTVAVLSILITITVLVFPKQNIHYAQGNEDSSSI